MPQIISQVKWPSHLDPPGWQVSVLIILLMVQSWNFKAAKMSLQLTHQCAWNYHVWWMGSPQSSVTDIQVSWAPLQDNWKELTKICSTSNRPILLVPSWARPPAYILRMENHPTILPLHGFSPRKTILPWGAPTLPSTPVPQTSSTQHKTSMRVTMLPNLTGYWNSIPHKLPDHLCTRRDMNMVDSTSRLSTKMPLIGWLVCPTLLSRTLVLTTI